MKAKLMVSVLVVLATLTAKASDLSSKERADLWAFKNVVSTSYEMLNQDANQMRDRAYYYNSLNYFQYGKRYQVIKENCNAVKASAMNLVALGAAIQVTEQTLKTVPELQTAEADSHLENLHVYINAIKAADDKCANPTKSLIELRKGIAALADVKAFLDTIILD